MKIRMKRGLWILGVTLIFVAWAAAALAAEFPNRPVTLICPWAPGGSTDVTLRVLADSTSRYLGQPVVVENKPGGGGTVGGATMAATAKPDGYTVAQIPISVIRYPYMMKVNWDPLKDFTYVIHLTGYTFGVVVQKEAPWKTWNEFIAYAKANPGKVTYATPGAGTSLHITMETIAIRQGIKWIQVPMKGGGETTPAVLGGHVTATADSNGLGATGGCGRAAPPGHLGQSAHQEVARCPHPEGTGVRDRLQLPLRDCRPQGHGPQGGEDPP